MERHDLLGCLHEALQPRTYFEIGVHVGMSLTLSRTRTVAVDPFFKITREVLCDLHLVRATSDEFFARRHPFAHFDEPAIDLAFIDGMHLSEYLLRDVMNTERFTHAASVIVLDDMLPRSDNEAARDREAAGLMARAWAGDVYKVIIALRRHRPDLVCLEVDTKPTGTVVLLAPDASSTALDRAYGDLVEEFVTPDPQSVPPEIRDRIRAVDPERLMSLPLWSRLRELRGAEDRLARRTIRSMVQEAGLLPAPAGR